MTSPYARRAGAWVSRALAVALLVGLAAPAAAETLRDESRETYPLQPGSRVEIDNVNGNLELSSWDRDEALVEITKVVKTRGRSSGDELEELRIEVRHSPESLELTTRQPTVASSVLAWFFGGVVQSQVNYRVTLPRTARLDATTVNGNVVIDDVRGALVAETTNGRIEIAGAGGETKASTTNGSIHAEFVEVGSASIELSTVNGGIDVYLPRSAAVDVSASAVNGGLQSDFAAVPSGSSAVLRRTLRGSINGGGGELNLRTVNGGIELRARDTVSER